MALTPEERREINRANASHSTGPKSPQGRRRASLNAMTHGLRAESLALPHEDAEELRQLTDDWLDYHQPSSPGDRAAVDRCVYSQLQLRRCARFHAAAVSEQVRKASFEWEWAREDEVERLKKLMETDPEEAVRLLRRSALGCRWMLEEWAELDRALVANGTWVDSQRDRAIRLLGSRPGVKALSEDEDAYMLRFYTLYTQEKPSARAMDFLSDPKNVPDTLVRNFTGAWRPDVATSLQTLRDTVAEETAGLAELEGRLRVEIEEPSRAGAVERAEALNGPDGVLLARYVRMHDSMYNRAYKELKQAEKEAAREDAPDSTASKRFDPFGEVEVLDLSVGRADAPNEANEGGPTGSSGASPGAAGVAFTGLEMAFVDGSRHEAGVTGPSAPLGAVETPPARGS